MLNTHFQVVRLSFWLLAYTYPYTPESQRTERNNILDLEDVFPRG